MNESSQAAMQLESRLTELARLFLERTQAELVTLHAHLRTLREGRPQALEEMKFVAHRIYGAGATLGFASIGERAAKLEQLIHEHPAPDAGALAAMTASVTQLADEVERVVRSRDAR